VSATAGTLFEGTRKLRPRGLLFYRLITQAARTPHVVTVTDRLFRATGRGRQSQRKANRNRWESDEGIE